VRFLTIQPLTPEFLPAALELDRLSLGGLWSTDGYLRELASPNSDLLILREIEGGKQTVENEWDRRGQGDTSGEQGLGIEYPNLPTPYPLSPISASPSIPHSPSPTLFALGCSWAILEEAHITLMAVHPAYQRQGLGQAMLCALLTTACKRQLERATLEVKVSNQAAISLYEKFGFKVAGRRKCYYQDTGEDALVMWRGGLHQSDFCKTLHQWWGQVSDRLQQVGWQLLQTESNYHNLLDSTIICD